MEKLKRRGKTIGFVPTMGYFHEGHLSLFRRARRENDVAVVSLFVNPTQFGPSEDFKRYPRDMKRDMLLCKKERVDYVFAPNVKTMYPGGYQTSVDPGKLASVLCGKSRPGHFRGVATVVAKLLNLARPTVLYLGQKDYQQCLIIQRLVADLDFPGRIKICPIVRDRSGLALSSRNTYLDEKGKHVALALIKGIRWFRAQVRKGARDARSLEKGVKRILMKEGARVDYAEILDARELSPLKKLSGKILLAVAAYVPAAKRRNAKREVRLIDNCMMKISKGGSI